MSEVIETLRKDHVNLTALLSLFDKQMAFFEEGEHPDYELLSDIVDYCLNYPDLRHHAMEDAVLEKLRDVAPEAADPIGDLDARHVELRALTARLQTALQQILNDAEVDRGAVVMLAQDFLRSYRNHIQGEDNMFFPAAEAALSEADWAEVARDVAELEDPLFGAKVAEEYELLHKAIMSWGAPVEAV
jgi:hemerythrin-like domain-containing protein